MPRARARSTCAGAFTEFVRATLAGFGYAVKVNDPYKGVELVRAYSSPAAGRHSLQIEVNKRLYMDSGSRAQSAGYAALRANLTRLIEAIREYAAGAAQRGR